MNFLQLCLNDETLIRDEHLVIERHAERFDVLVKRGFKKPLVITMKAHELFLRVENGAEVELMLIEDASAPGFLNLIIENRALVNFYLMSKVSLECERVLKAQIVIAQDAALSFYDVQLSEGSFSLDIELKLSGQRAALHYGGIQHLKGKSSSSTELVIRHEAPNTSSTQEFRGIYADNAQGLFLGKVIVSEEAPESSAKQLYKAVVLSEKAVAKVRPQLEINNRHIKASHGASIGKLDENSLFYLCSRGPSMSQAKTMLITSMAAQIIEPMGQGAIASFVAESISQAIHAMEVSHAHRLA